MGRATVRAPMEKPSALRAPLFKQLVDQLDDDARHVALDLGSVGTEMLSLLGRFRCCVEIAGLADDDGLARLEAAADNEQRVAIAESLLPKRRPDDPADLVFCWDLLNYLKPDSITALTGAIATRLRPGAHAHALIAYSDKTMPERPARWVPAEDGVLVDRAPSAVTIKAPRYSPELLGRIMSGFTIRHARLLTNGMQEFIFRLDR
jgi:hypothetical protein